MHTNIGLAQHIKRGIKEKWRYVWGTIGRRLTRQIILDVQQRYPDNINKHLSLIETYIGERSLDCVNYIKSYVWWDDEKDDPIYSKEYDFYKNTWMSADGMFEVAIKKGTIDKMPDIEGVCLWKKGHVGVYLGNGRVGEARSTKMGCIETSLFGEDASKWTHYFYCPFIEYIKGDDNMPEIPQWKKDCADYLVKQGYLNTPHDPLEILDIGTLGAILKNRDEKIKEILKQI